MVFLVGLVVHCVNLVYFEGWYFCIAMIYIKFRIANISFSRWINTTCRAAYENF